VFDRESRAVGSYRSRSFGTDPVSVRQTPACLTSRSGEKGNKHRLESSQTQTRSKECLHPCQSAGGGRVGPSRIWEPRKDEEIRQQVESKRVLFPFVFIFAFHSTVQQTPGLLERSAPTQEPLVSSLRLLYMTPSLFASIKTSGRPFRFASWRRSKRREVKTSRRRNRGI
jgi:hypothetical protein